MPLRLRRSLLVSYQAPLARQVPNAPDVIRQTRFYRWRLAEALVYPTQIVICKALAVVVSTQIRTVPAWVVFGDRVLFHSLSKKRSGGGQVLQEIGGDAVALLKIFGIVVGEPDLSLRVLPC
jgi:hypothetical protein